MKEPSLWEPAQEAPPAPAPEIKPVTPHNGTETSREAAEMAEPRASSDCGRILAYLRTRPDGATREEIAKALEMLIQTVTPRVWALLNRKGWALAYETGDTREGETGRKSKVVYAVKARKQS
jgi:hypothetical protein